jgi:hypothetical protein
VRGKGKAIVNKKVGNGDVGRARDGSNGENDVSGDRAERQGKLSERKPGWKKERRKWGTETEQEKLVRMEWSGPKGSDQKAERGEGGLGENASHNFTVENEIV